jgi:transposase-like protein
MTGTLSVPTRTRQVVRRSPQEWRELMDAYARCGQTRKQFCAREQLALSTFDWWRRRLQEETGTAVSERRHALRGLTGAPLFVELGPARKPESRPPRAWEVELDLGAGVVLRLRRGVVSC